MDWFYADVYYVAGRGIMTGYHDADGNPLWIFGPNDALLREDLACLLYKYLDPDNAAEMTASDRFTQVRNATPLSDVADGAYYTPAVNYCYEQGIMTGYDERAGEAAGTLGVGQTVTRAEFATTLYRLHGVDVDDEASYESFPDAADVEDWAADAMAWCVSNYIITGDDGRLNPNEEAKRAQIAAMMMRFTMGFSAHHVGSAIVALGLTELHLNFFSDLPFSESISADLIELSDGLESWTVASFERVSDSEFDVVLEGSDPIDEEGGAVVFAEGSFENVHALGYVSVVGKEPDPQILEADSSSGQGYVNGRFIIPIDIDSAEFSEDVAASAFSLPSDSSISVTDVALLSESVAAVTFSVPGATPREQFAALDAALTEGILVASAATNVGDLTAMARNVVRAQEWSAVEGRSFTYEETTLEYVQARATASLAVEGSTLNGDGSLTVSARVTMGTVDVGSVDLMRTSASGISVYDRTDATSAVADEGSIAIDSATSFTLTKTISADHVAIMPKDGETQDGFAEGISPEALLGLFAGQYLSVSGGVIDAWGIDQDVADILISIHSADEDGASALADSSEDDTSSYYSSKSVATTVKSLEATQEIFSMAGSLCSGIVQVVSQSGNTGVGIGNIISGIGGVFGFAATIAELAGGGSEYSIDEVMTEVQSVNSSVNTVSAEVGSLNDLLEAAASREQYLSSYKTFVSNCNKVYGNSPYSLSDYLTEAMGSLTEDDLKVIEPDENGMVSYDDLSDNAKTVLSNFVTKVQKYADSCNVTTYQLVQELADDILGTEAASYSGICEVYFDYIASFYNWEPETYLPRRAFLSYASGAFLLAYSACMVETIVEGVEDGDALGTYADRRSALVKYFLMVKERIYGLTATEYDALYGTNTAESSDSPDTVTKSQLLLRTEDYNDTQIVNLVASSSHNLFKADNLFATPIWDLSYQDAWDSKSVDDVPTYSYDESKTITAGNLLTMADRLSKLYSKGLVPFSTLADELAAMGTTTVTYDGTDGQSETEYVYGQVSFANSLGLSSITTDETLAEKKSNGKESKHGYTYRIHEGYSMLTSSVTMKKVQDKPSIRHVRQWTGTVYDLSKDSSAENTVIYSAKSYYSYAHWHIQIWLYNYLMFSEGEAAQGR